MKNTQKGFVVPLVIAIIAFLVIGVGVYYSKNKSNLSLSTTSNSNNSQNTEMANWKTFKDETNGFEFKYPSDWTIQKNDPYGWVVRKYPDYGFYLGVIPHPYSRGIESAVDSHKKLTLIDGHKALIGGTEEYVVKNPPVEDSVYVEIETTLSPSLSHIVTISMDSNNHTKEMRKIFSNILSTFKFSK